MGLDAEQHHPCLKKYLPATLCNAPAANDNYYVPLVNYDLYGAKNKWQLVELPFLLDVLRFIFNSKLNADKQKI